MLQSSHWNYTYYHEEWSYDNNFLYFLDIQYTDNYVVSLRWQDIKNTYQRESFPGQVHMTNKLTLGRRTSNLTNILQTITNVLELDNTIPVKSHLFKIFVASLNGHIH